MLYKNKNSQGFTIIELMIATLVFSMVLIVCLTTFLQISRFFYKGVNLTLIQNDARSVTDSISKDIKFAKNAPDNSHLNRGYFCVGLHRYKFMQYNHVDLDTWSQSNNYGLVRENISAGCPDPSVPGSGSQPEEMLGTNMQLNKLGVNCVNSQCTIDINVIFYGVDNTVFTSSEHPGLTDQDHINASKDPDAQCTGALDGSQYCATAAYKLTVLQTF